MSGFGWSITDVILVVKLIARITKALKETGGARDDYQRSIQFLSGLETTLKNLSVAGKVLPQTAAAGETIRQAEEIVRALDPLLKDCRRFESSLGVGTSQSRASQTASRLRWSFRQAKDVADLEERVSVPLAAVNANIGMQILELINTVQKTLPVSVCDALSAKINTAISNCLRTELEPVSQAINAQALFSRQITRSLETNHAVQLNAQQALRSSLEGNLAELQTEIRLLQAAVQGNSVMLTHFRDVVFSNADGTCSSSRLFSPYERISRSLRTLAHTVHELLVVFLKLIWPLLLLLLRKMHAAESPLTRLLIGDSILFEDALGRTRSLPFEFFQHWDVFLPYLHKTFEQVPGLCNLTLKRYHLINSRSGKLIDPQTWAVNIRPGSRLSMAIAVFKISSTKRACPHCGGTQKLTRLDTFATCSTCNADYRLLEPGTRRSITPSDGAYGSGGLRALHSSYQAEGIPQWPTLTFPTLGSLSASFGEISESAAPTQNLRMFKKVDVLFVNDADRTMAVFEQLLNAVGETDDLRTFLRHVEPAFSQLIRLARFELQQSINLFDFNLWWMRACNRTINHLQSWADNAWTSSLSSEGELLDGGWVESAISHWAPSLRQDIINGNQTISSGTIIIIVKAQIRRDILRVQSDTTILEIKTMLERIEGIQTHHQCLIYRGKRLEDSFCVSHYNISTEYYIHLVLTFQSNSGYYYDQPLPDWLLYDGEQSQPDNGTQPRVAADLEQILINSGFSPLAVLEVISKWCNSTIDECIQGHAIHGASSTILSEDDLSSVD